MSLGLLARRKLELQDAEEREHLWLHIGYANARLQALPEAGSTDDEELEDPYAELAQASALKCALRIDCCLAELHDFTAGVDCFLSTPREALAIVEQYVELRKQAEALRDAVRLFIANQEESWPWTIYRRRCGASHSSSGCLP